MMLKATLWYDTNRTGAVISISLENGGSEQFGGSPEITQLVRSHVRSQGRCFRYKIRYVNLCFSDKFESSASLLLPSKTVSCFSAFSWGGLAAGRQC